MGPGGIRRIGSDHQLLAPGWAPDQRHIHREAIGLPRRHEAHEPKAENGGMILAEARLLGHRMLEPPVALEGAVAHQRQEAVLRGGKGLQGWLDKPPQPRLRAPVCGTQQTAILLGGQMLRAMPGQRRQMGPCALQEVQDQEPAEDQLVPMAETGPQDPQARRDAAGQTGQGQGPGLLRDTRSDRHSRSSILGSAWAVKDFHTVNSANLSPLSYYDARRFAAQRVKTGDVLELRRDYDNPVDPNAIAVYHRAGQLGFLPIMLAQRLAPELDAGEVITARGVSVIQADVAEITLGLALPS
jgi:HIRAN domain